MRSIDKLLFLCMLLALTLPSRMHSQIKVSNNNYVGINYDPIPISRFVINGSGFIDYQAYIYNPNISTSGGALYVHSEPGTSSGKHVKAIQAVTPNGSNNSQYCIYGGSYGTSASTLGRSYGVYGLAGNSANGYNYGVYGYLYGSNNGAAIFGTVGGGDISVAGKYAGYFQGNVKCSNNIYAAAFITQSDEKFKTNIVELNTTEILEPFALLKPVSYNLKQLEVQNEKTDTIGFSKTYYESESFFKTTRYGLIAQDVKKIYPALVSSDDNGDLSVDYLGLIPILIRAIQEQEKKIGSMELELEKLREVINAIKQ